jgi:hypothetical protein
MGISSTRRSSLGFRYCLSGLADHYRHFAARANGVTGRASRADHTLRPQLGATARGVVLHHELAAHLAMRWPQIRLDGCAPERAPVGEVRLGLVRTLKYFRFRTERMILGVLGPQQSAILSPRAKPTDRSTFCSMPGGRFHAASDATSLRGRLLGHWESGLRAPWNQSAIASASKPPSPLPRIRRASAGVLNRPRALRQTMDSRNQVRRLPRSERLRQCRGEGVHAARKDWTDRKIASSQAGPCVAPIRRLSMQPHQKCSTQDDWRWQFLSTCVA